jgi:hypothetical protein
MLADGLPIRGDLAVANGELISVIRMLKRDVEMEREDPGLPV